MKNPFPILQPATDFAGELGIISPCSECNKYTNPDTNDKQIQLPPCPRRFWIEQQEAYKKNLRDGEVPAYLTDTGTEDQNTLKNPVYSRAQKSILVWVAKLVKNRPILQNGVTINPDILTPGFNTDYISCESMPYVVDENQQSIFSRGVYKEWDQVLMTPTYRNQMDSFGSTENFTLISGTVRKVNFHRNFSLESPIWDKIVSGT